MVDERFSESKFRALGLDSERARVLADDLAAAVQAELHRVVVKRMAEIVKELNDTGHCLSLEEEELGSISYRDVRKDASGAEQCRLRLGVDFVVSTGYAHLMSVDEAMKALGISE